MHVNHFWWQVVQKDASGPKAQSQPALCTNQMISFFQQFKSQKYSHIIRNCTITASYSRRSKSAFSVGIILIEDHSWFWSRVDLPAVHWVSAWQYLAICGWEARCEMCIMYRSQRGSCTGRKGALMRAVCCFHIPRQQCTTHTAYTF